MNYEIRKLKNSALLKKTKALVLEERKITLEVLHHLAEVWRRRLHQFRGFRSLFEYATSELGYSNGAAGRRIAAMELLIEIPEVEEKIKAGELNLTTVAQAQRLFDSEEKLEQPIPLEKKKVILENLKNKSTRAVEMELLNHSSQPFSFQKPDQIKPVAPSHSEIRFIADQNLLDQLETIKGLLANKHPHLTLAELFAEMAKLSLEKLQPKEPKTKTQSKIAKQQSEQQLKQQSKQPHKQGHKPQSEQIMENSGDTTSAQFCAEPKTVESVQINKENATSEDALKKASSRYIPVEIKRAVYKRDDGICQFIDPVSGRKCGSRHGIQYDHATLPFAMGGQATVESLQLVCAIHNRIRAIHWYGPKKMSAYMRVES